jgi:hypothetical protein
MKLSEYISVMIDSRVCERDRFEARIHDKAISLSNENTTHWTLANSYMRDIAINSEHLRDIDKELAILNTIKQHIDHLEYTVSSIILDGSPNGAKVSQIRQLFEIEYSGE